MTFMKRMREETERWDAFWPVIAHLNLPHWDSVFHLPKLLLSLGGLLSCRLSKCFFYFSPFSTGFLMYWLQCWLKAILNMTSLKFTLGSSPARLHLGLASLRAPVVIFCYSSDGCHTDHTFLIFIASLSLSHTHAHSFSFSLSAFSEKDYIPPLKNWTDKSSWEFWSPDVFDFKGPPSTPQAA